MLFYCLFQYFEEKEYPTESKWNKTFGNLIFGRNVIQRTWSGRQETNEEAMRQGGAPTPWARPHPCGPLVAPPTYFFLLYIPTYPETIKGHHEKPNSTAATFGIREIPSWSLRRHSAGGGIDHGGLLHQHHSPSDEL